MPSDARAHHPAPDRIEMTKTLKVLLVVLAAVLIVGTYLYPDLGVSWLGQIAVFAFVLWLISRMKRTG